MGLLLEVVNAKKVIRNRFALRQSLRAIVALACLTPVCADSSAYGQLRTGRDAPRDYYPEASAAKVPRPAGNPLRQSKPNDVKTTTSKKTVSLESIANDPPSEDLQRLSGPGIENLPEALASSKRKERPVVTEVAPARFETSAKNSVGTPGTNAVRSENPSESRTVELAAHQAATRQHPVNAGNVIKRVTPARVVSDDSSVLQSPASNSHIDPSTELGTYADGGVPVDEAYGFDGYVVGDPMGDSHSFRQRGQYTSCGDPACSECGPGYPTLNIRIGFPPLLRCDRITARVEAATFWPGSQSIPALIRTAEVGVPESRDLFGGTQNLDQSVQGLRGEFGLRYGIANCNTLQFRFFDAGAQSLTFDSPRSSEASIVRPYQDGSQTPLVQDAVSIKEPGISNGSALAHAFSDVQGGDILFRRLWMQNCDASVEWLVGYQNARLTDSIDVHTTTIPTGSTTLLELRDQFRTENQFHGATLGLSRMVYSPRWSLGSMFKLGLGDMQRDVSISGFQKVGSAPSTSNGLLARSPANGFYSSNTFVVSPEVNVTLGYRLTQNLEATVGYTYLGLPKVARAGEQIDTVSDLDSVNPTRPRFSLQESNFSLHSLNYGLQYRY